MRGTPWRKKKKKDSKTNNETPHLEPPFVGTPDLERRMDELQIWSHGFKQQGFVDGSQRAAGHGRAEEDDALPLWPMAVQFKDEPPLLVDEPPSMPTTTVHRNLEIWSLSFLSFS
ncbi:uncharacterized protein J3R85_011831 [Psidium guajava]|nr:uncharacterized protein J3R85_011831 [Psidium guajava]